MNYSETRIYKIAVESHKLAQKVVPAYSSKFSKKTYTQDQHIAVLCIKAKIRQKLRETEEMLIHTPHLCEAIGLSQVPDFTTMCRAMKRLRNKVLTVLLYLTASVLPVSGKASIDATGFDKRHSSKHYVKRCKMKLGSMKTTFIVDTSTLVILAVHATVTRKHDSKIILPLVHKALKSFRITVLPADKGYDDRTVRDELRQLGIRPLIKHREFKPVDKTNNRRMKSEDYHQRSMSETVNSMLKRKYDDTLHTKSYWNQYKEIMLMAVVHNIERNISYFCFIYWRIATKVTHLRYGFQLFYMEKGLAPVIKAMTTALGIMFVLFLIVTFAFKTSILTSNPCWAKVQNGLAPLEGHIRAQANLVLEAECLHKVVFTDSPNVCKLTCNEHYDREKITACLHACDDSRAGTFIIALPKKIEKQMNKALTEKDIRWFRDSEPVVYTLKCHFTGLQPGMQTCVHSTDEWVCNLSGKDETFSLTYPLYVKASAEGTCSIVYSETTGKVG